jgi:hypothetical protein
LYFTKTVNNKGVRAMYGVILILTPLTLLVSRQGYAAGVSLTVKAVDRRRGMCRISIDTEWNQQKEAS